MARHEILHEESPASARWFRVVRGDLLREPVDAIVNAANGALAHGGGVAGALARAAGPALQDESDRLVAARGVLPTGSAVVTGAGRLPFKGVIHAIGPRRGEGNEQALLERALRAAFDCAHAAGWRSLSFPAVSSGIFGVPLEVCALAYLRAVRGWFCAANETTVVEIRLCLHDEERIAAVRAVLSPA